MQPKERSKIKTINYNTITAESWETSEVKKKINNIIFFVYEQPTGYSYRDLDRLEFKGVLHYNLAQLDNDHIQIKKDWKIIQTKVIEGIADSLSDADGQYLAASTSGTGRSCAYGNNLERRAKQRSYSLKHSYLKYYYLLNYDKLESSGEDSTRDILRELKTSILGKALRTLSENYNINFNPKNKSAFRHLVKKVFAVDQKKLIEEIEKENLTVKTIPINKDGYPYEAMSFPKFSLVDLIHEDWDAKSDLYDESVFKNLIKDGFIFITVRKEKIRNNNKYIYNEWPEWTINDIFIWKPDQRDLNRIKAEWLTVRSYIRKNRLHITEKKHGEGFRKENNLPKQSQTEFIHIRPHAKNSSELDLPYKSYTNGRIEISWQSFWFNKQYIAKIIQEYRNEN